MNTLWHFMNLEEGGGGLFNNILPPMEEAQLRKRAREMCIIELFHILACIAQIVLYSTLSLETCGMACLSISVVQLLVAHRVPNYDAFQAMEAIYLMVIAMIAFSALMELTGGESSVAEMGILAPSLFLFAKFIKAGVREIAYNEDYHVLSRHIRERTREAHNADRRQIPAENLDALYRRASLVSPEFEAEVRGDVATLLANIGAARRSVIEAPSYNALTENVQNFNRLMTNPFNAVKRKVQTAVLAKVGSKTEELYTLLQESIRLFFLSKIAPNQTSQQQRALFLLLADSFDRNRVMAISEEGLAELPSGCTTKEGFLFQLQECFDGAEIDHEGFLGELHALLPDPPRDTTYAIHLQKMVTSMLSAMFKALIKNPAASEEAPLVEVPDLSEAFALSLAQAREVLNEINALFGRDFIAYTDQEARKQAEPAGERSREAKRPEQKRPEQKRPEQKREVQPAEPAPLPDEYDRFAAFIELSIHRWRELRPTAIPRLNAVPSLQELAEAQGKFCFELAQLMHQVLGQGHKNAILDLITYTSSLTYEGKPGDLLKKYHATFMAYTPLLQVAYTPLLQAENQRHGQGHGAGPGPANAESGMGLQVGFVAEPAPPPDECDQFAAFLATIVLPIHQWKELRPTAIPRLNAVPSLQELAEAQGKFCFELAQLMQQVPGKIEKDVILNLITYTSSLTYEGKPDDLLKKYHATFIAYTPLLKAKNQGNGQAHGAGPGPANAGSGLGLQIGLVDDSGRERKADVEFD